MTRILSLIFFLLLSISIFAQSAKKEHELISYGRNKHAVAEVKRLKEGALLVRLFDKTVQLDFLNKQGKSESIINKFKDKITNDHIEIIHAYRDNFSFCPVYFFHSKHSEIVSEGRLDDVTFVNQFGVEDTSIHVNEQFYFTSEISENRIISTGSYRKKYSKEMDELDDDLVLIKSSFEAVVIMDQLFVRLDVPFPYFARTFSKVPFLQRSKSKSIARLNQKLVFYFKKYEEVEMDLITEEVLIMPKK